MNKSKIVYWFVFFTLAFYQMYLYIKSKVIESFKYIENRMFVYRPVCKEKDEV